MNASWACGQYYILIVSVYVVVFWYLRQRFDIAWRERPHLLDRRQWPME